jgi:hypothetical protein
MTTNQALTFTAAERHSTNARISLGI